MASFEDVRRIALSLPSTAERASYGGAPSWTVGGKAFVWDRPLRERDRADLTAAGSEVPEGPVLGVLTADEGEKQALLADDPRLFFTVPHLDGYPAVLVLLDRIGEQELHELVVEAWLARAPTKLAAAFRAAPS